MVEVPNLNKLKWTLAYFLAKLVSFAAVVEAENMVAHCYISHNLHICTLNQQ